MLVLSRRKDETIMIGDTVEITVVDVRGDTVRLGITAPRSVSVHRKEIYDAIQAENVAAVQEPAPDQSSVGGLGDLLKKTAGAGGMLPGFKPAGLSGLSGLSKLSGPKLNSEKPAETPRSTRVISKFADKQGPQKRKN